MEENNEVEEKINEQNSNAVEGNTDVDTAVSPYGNINAVG